VRAPQHNTDIIKIAEGFTGPPVYRKTAVAVMLTVKQFDDAIIGEKRSILLMINHGINPGLTGYVCFDRYMQL